MKFTCSVTINAPLEKVVALFNNKEKLKEWQEGFESITHLSGSEGSVGAKSKIIYRRGKHTIELTETILASNLPYEITGLYEHIHMSNTMRNSFTTINNGQTLWESHIEYAKFKKLMPNIMAWLMPGMFKKQTQKWLDNFKFFAEKEINSTNQ